MINNPGVNAGSFTYTFPDYTLLKEGEIQAIFNFKNITLTHQPLIADYVLKFVIYKNLKSFMISSIVGNTIYDIPVIQKDYYDGLLSKKEFEVSILQSFLSSIDLINYRMLTDFVNIKFYNTDGKMKNMLLNDKTVGDVLDIGIVSLPLTPTTGDKYIISGSPGITLEGKEYQIAICKDPSTWIYQRPVVNDCVFVISKNTKYIYTSQGWCVPVYDIPLKISAEVVKMNSIAVSDSLLINDIKNAIYNKYKDSFGADISIYRSEIIEVIQSVTGVSNCRLIEPKTSLFFNYNIDNFTQQQLLEYTPEMVYFKLEDITISLISSQFF